MAPPSMTPYVTPHILHKHYAQAHDDPEMSSRECSLIFVHLP